MAASTQAELPAPIDLTHHFSDASKNKQGNPFKAFYRFFQIPGIGNFAGGLPNNNYFPFDTLEGVAAYPERFKPTPAIPVDPPSSKSQNVEGTSPDAGSRREGSRVVVPKVSTNNNLLQKIDLKSALQYGDAHGLPPLYAWIRQFTREYLHPAVPYKDGPEVILTTGNTDGFSKSLEALMDPWREGVDPIEKKPGLLVEEFMYTPPAIRAKSYKANIVSVAMDDEGIMASGKGGLEDVLANWDASLGRRPHLLYTVTIGQNPTGGVLSVARRKEIYAVCVKYDILIIEDEPYWYLQYPSANKLSQQHRGHPVSTESQPRMTSYSSTGFPFLDSLVPSFLSIDYEGRVVRLDTFSKTVAPGCRLGWITAQPALIEKIFLATQQTTQQPSGFVQSMIAQLLMGTSGSAPPTATSTSSFGLGGFFSPSPAKIQNGWDITGWVRWLEGLRGNYERRMNTMCSILESGKYTLKTGRKRRQASYTAELQGLEADPSAVIDSGEEWRHVVRRQMYDFTWPMGGMFVWLKLDFDHHHLASKFGGAKLAAAWWVLLTEKPFLILASPGGMFSATPEVKDAKGYAYSRICFAAVDEVEVESLTRRFVDGIHAFWEIRDGKRIEELLDDSPWLMERHEEEMQAQMGGLTF